MKDDIEFIITKKVKPIKGATLLEGLPGIGLVGTIATSYVVQKLNMEIIGHVYSKYFPPIVAIHKYKPYYPMRIYYSKKENLFAILSEFVVPTTKVIELSEKIDEFTKKNNISRIISLGSITIKGQQDTVYAIASHEKDSKELAKISGVEIIKEGATTGVTAMLLAKGMSNNNSVISLLAEAKGEYIDPGAASMVIKILNKIIKPNIDTNSLDKEAKNLEKEMGNIVKKAKNEQTRYKKMEDFGFYG